MKPTSRPPQAARKHVLCAERFGRTEGRGHLFTAEQELVGPEL